MLKILLPVLIVLLSAPSPAQACECREITSQKAAKIYNDADIVISGVIETASKGFSERGPMVKIKVENIIKGENVPELITANYNPNLPACGNEFHKGEEVSLALYDTRELGITKNNTRGYGFRVMTPCFQDMVQYHLKEMNLDNKKEE